MKKILFSLCVVFGSLVFAKPIVIVSILPQEVFVKKISKDMVDVTLMVTPGSSPHSYEPKPSQMKALSNADVYFSIGVEFEHAWLEKFKSQNPSLKFVNISDKVTKINMGEHHHEEEGHDHEEDEHEHEEEGDEHHHEGVDPHTWTSPKNVAIMAQSIYTTLVEIDPKNEKFYKTNLNNFIKEINETDLEIRDTLKNVEKNAKFMVFHPSWGYFANEYDLTQIAVEVDGKSPKPKEMVMIIKEAKEEKVKVIFTQPEFSDKSARMIAKELGISVKKTSPLNPKWSQNLINMAKDIAKK